ncbi:MAG: hypothetical protein RR585_00810 [Coprobacillus sp.]
MKYRKIKVWILVMLIGLLVISFLISIYFRISSTSVISADYFSEDSTQLIHKIHDITDDQYLYTPFMAVLFVRSLIIIALPIVSGALVYKQKVLKNVIYFLGSCYLFFIETINVANASEGIHNLFRKIKVSYYLGITDMPWLLYYLSVLVIIVLMIGLVSHEIYINKKK